MSGVTTPVQFRLLSHRNSVLNPADVYTEEDVKAACRDSLPPACTLEALSFSFDRAGELEQAAQQPVVNLRVRTDGVAASHALRSAVLSRDFDKAVTLQLASKCTPLQKPRLEPGENVRITGSLKPATVLKVDASSSRCSVQPLTKGGLLDGSPVELPVSQLWPAAAIVRSDCSLFAEELDQSSAASVGVLTSHQREKLDEVFGDNEHEPASVTIAHDISVSGPAGSGKTFIALHTALRTLQRGGRVYFVARNSALGTFAAAWIAVRARGLKLSAAEVLSRMHVLCMPLSQPPRRVFLRDGRFVTLTHETGQEPASGTASQTQLAFPDLVIVDEAHHIYGDPGTRKAMETHVGAQTKRFLLSDASQAGNRNHAKLYGIAGLKEVQLQEVVRCSERIVAGAMAFQLGGEEKLLTKCTHTVTGPPLKSFLFEYDTNTGSDQEGSHPPKSLLETYSDFISRAFDHVKESFSGLKLHNRVAIVGPDTDFCDELQPILENALRAAFPTWNFRIVTAEEASSDIGPELGHTGDEGIDWVIFDSIHQLDGLERLIVIPVGLDAAIEGMPSKLLVSPAQPAAVGAPSLPAPCDSLEMQTRSRLYRAVTRAHLMVVIVNHFVKGGWLEFLGHVRLTSDEAFDRNTELARADSAAADDMVLSDVAAAIEAADASLAPGVVAVLTPHVTQAMELGVEMSSAVQAALHDWRALHRNVHMSVQRAAMHDEAIRWGGVLQDEAAAIDEVTTEVATKSFQGGTGTRSIQDAAREGWTAFREKERKRGIVREIDMFLARQPSVKPLSSSVVAALCRDISERLCRQQQQLEPGHKVNRVAAEAAVTAAVVAALDAWQKLEAEATSAVTGIVEDGLPDSRFRALIQGCKDELALKVGAQVLGGTPLAAAAKASVEQTISAHLGSRAKNVLEPMDLDDAANAAVARSLEAWMRLDHDARCAESEAAKLLVAQWESMLSSTRTILEEEATHRRLYLDANTKARLATLLVANEWQAHSDHIAKIAAESNESEPSLTTQAAVPTVPAGDEQANNRSQGGGSAAANREGGVFQRIKTRLKLAIDRVTRAVSAPAPAADHSVAIFAPAPLPLTGQAAKALDEWDAEQRRVHAEAAAVTSCIEQEASFQRLQLTDATVDQLTKRVQAMQRFETHSSAGHSASLAELVRRALTEWQKQLIKRQVQQTIWDTCGNSLGAGRSARNAVKFMPFKQGGRGLDYDGLCIVFSMLDMQRDLPAAACVCKRWSAVVTDSSWMPNLLAFSWGSGIVNGQDHASPSPTLLPFSQTHSVWRIVCADQATFAVTVDGSVWHWGMMWDSNREEDAVRVPTRIKELRDVQAIACTPPGYYHGRIRSRGFNCAAITRSGDLFTWGGANYFNQLLQPSPHSYSVERPVAVDVSRLKPVAARFSAPVKVTHVSVGLYFLAVQVSGQEANTGKPTTSIFRQGHFMPVRMVPPFCEEPGLQGLELRQLAAGGFHCVAVTTRGDVWTWGHPTGSDISNGDLLGRGQSYNEASVVRLQLPAVLQTPGLGPVAEVSCSTYISVAVTMDGRCFSWGDSDGGALGRQRGGGDQPVWVSDIRGANVVHSASAYTNAAVATRDGRVYVWGGSQWGGGIAAGRDSSLPTEVHWAGVPACYHCSSIALAFRHGYLIFRKGQ